jgi:hypothetical protein
VPLSDKARTEFKLSSTEKKLATKLPSTSSYSSRRMAS